MNIIKLFLIILSFAFTYGYCHTMCTQETQIQGLEMGYIIEKQPTKFFIGLELRTNNAECSLTMPAHKNKFFSENVPGKIPNKINGNILALYTDYEGDYTKPYSWILGCEVSSLDEIPTGLIGKIIPESKYAVFTTQGEFPQGLIATWQRIWESTIPRSYTSDFELYCSDFHPEKNPDVKVYIAIDENKNPLLESVLLGRWDTFRSGSVFSPLAHGDFRETNQNAIYAWGMDYAPGNGVMEKNTNRIPSETEIEQTIKYFSDKKLPFIWWSSAKELETKGFQSGGILTGIALDISEGVPEKPTSSLHIQIKIIESDSDLNAFSELAATAFAMNPNASSQYHALNSSLMKNDQQIHFLAFLDETPVGTATLSISPSSAGVWNLATLPEHRNHGIGVALVHAALVEAKRRKYAHVMAILMPKGMAWGLFTKLGFNEICQFPFYVHGVSAENLEK